jgi:hypothetical protein
MCTGSVPRRRVQLPSSLATITEDVAQSSQVKNTFNLLEYVHMIVAKCRRELSASVFVSEKRTVEVVQ